MILSFGWTSQYLPPVGTKDTTRRLWKPSTIAAWQKAWDDRPGFLHTAVNKCLAYGGERIGSIQLTDRPFLQPLSQMPEEDLAREGGMVSSVNDFIDRYFDGNQETIVAVVRFKFIPLANPVSRTQLWP